MINETLLRRIHGCQVSAQEYSQAEEECQCEVCGHFWGPGMRWPALSRRGAAHRECAPEWFQQEAGP